MNPDNPKKTLNQILTRNTLIEVQNMPWSAEYDYNASLVTHSNWLNLGVEHIHSKFNIVLNKPRELKTNNISLRAHVSQITTTLCLSTGAYKIQIWFYMWSSHINFGPHVWQLLLHKMNSKSQATNFHLYSFFNSKGDLTPHLLTNSTPTHHNPVCM